MQASHILRRNAPNRLSTRRIRFLQLFSVFASFSLPLFLFLLLLGLGAMSFGVVQAQLDLRTVVNYWAVNETPQSVQLNVLFSVVDNNQQVVPLDIDTVDVMLDDGSRGQANVAQTDFPFYIAMLLDTSGSMTAENPAMRQAAQGFVGNVPDNAQFSLFTFNDQVSNPVPFGVAGPNTLMANINDVRSTANAGTCLYDAIWQGLDALSNQQIGRRGIVVFTDGVDRNSQGNPCSSVGLNQVIERANNPDYRAPVYVLGLENPDAAPGDGLDRRGLQRLASETGGTVVFGSAASTLFNQIVQTLANQYYAQITFFPRAGEHTATLSPIVEGGLQVAPGQVRFTTRTDKILPFSLNYGAVRRDDANDTYSLPLSAVGAGRLRQLQVTVLEVASSLERWSQVYDTVPPEIVVPGSTLTNDEDYAIVISALGAQGPLLTQALRVEFRDVAEVQRAAAPALTITDQQRDTANNVLVISLALSGQDQMQYLEYSVQDATKTTLPGRKYRTNGVENVLRVPLEGLRIGAEYCVSMIPYNMGDQPLIAPLQTCFINGTLQPPELDLTRIDHPEGSDDVTLYLTSNYTDDVDVLRVSVWDRETETSLDEFTVEARSEMPTTVSLRPEQLGYEVRSLRVELMLLAADRAPLLEEPVAREFLYQPPSRIGLTGILLAVGLLLVIVLVIFFIVRMSRDRTDDKSKGKGKKPSGPTFSAPYTGSGADQWGNQAETRVDMEFTNPKPPTLANRKQLTDAGWQQQRPVDGGGTVVFQPEKTTISVVVDRSAYDVRMNHQTLTGTNFTVGRKGEGPGWQGWNEGLMLEFDPRESTVSRRHLTFVYFPSGQTYVVTDHKSSSGTVVRWY